MEFLFYLSNKNAFYVQTRSTIRICKNSLQHKLIKFMNANYMFYILFEPYSVTDYGLSGP